MSYERHLIPWPTKGPLTQWEGTCGDNWWEFGEEKKCLFECKSLRRHMAPTHHHTYFVSILITVCLCFVLFIPGLSPTTFPNTTVFLVAWGKVQNTSEAGALPKASVTRTETPVSHLRLSWRWEPLLGGETMGKQVSVSVCFVC